MRAIYWLGDRVGLLIGANVLLLGGWIVLAVIVYDRLPDLIPAHFTLTGEPTRLESTTFVRWLMLPLVTIGLVLFLPLIERAGRWLNSRGRYTGQRFDASAVHLRRAYMYMVSTLLIIAMAALHAGQWVVASGRSESVPAVLLLVSAGALLAILILIIPLHRALRPVSSSRTQ